MNALIEKAKNEFADIFGEGAAAFGHAPGRVEVIGNHTDYNDGFILAAAIDRGIAVAGRAVAGGVARIYSRTFNSGASFAIAAPEKSAEAPWANYVMGVVWQLRNRGISPGAFEAMIVGDVPLGAGLSSSAAIEVATASFLKALNGFDMGSIDMARNCQAAENDFVGVNCGILDQFASVMGRDGELVFLDCRNLSAYAYYPLRGDVRLVIANTNAPHALVDGAYNDRRASCLRAARVCAGRFPGKGITHLRDVTLDELDRCRGELGEIDYRRARHIVTENGRVRIGAEALDKGDPVAMGRMMTESHLSSRDWFENSSRELDIMVDAALAIPGCYGARLSGGGFGGATINLVDTDGAEEFGGKLCAAYAEKTGIQPEIHLFNASPGAVGGVFRTEG